MKNIVIQEIDTSNGVIFPFYDADTNIIFLCGKVRRDDCDVYEAVTPLTRFSDAHLQVCIRAACCGDCDVFAWTG